MQNSFEMACVDFAKRCCSVAPARTVSAKILQQMFHQHMEARLQVRDVLLVPRSSRNWDPAEGCLTGFCALPQSQLLPNAAQRLHEGSNCPRGPLYIHKWTLFNLWLSALLLVIRADTGANQTQRSVFTRM